MNTVLDRPAPESAANSANRRVWQSAPLRRFLLLQGAGQTADAMISLALAQVVVFQLERGATPGTIAKLMLTAALPYLVIGPVAGFVTDRWQRRTSLCISSLVRCALGIGGLIVPLTLSRVLGYSTASCVVAAGGVAFTLRATSIPHLARPDQFVAVNSTVSLVQKLAGTIGFGGGMVLVALSPMWAMITGAVLHAGAAWGYATSRFDLGGGLPAAKLRSGPRFDGGLRRQLGGLLTARAVRAAVASILIHRAVYGAAVASFVLLADARYGLNASGFALAIGITATGAFVGSLLVVPLTSLTGRRGAVLLSFLLCSSAMLFAGFNGESWAVMTAMTIGSFSFQTVRLIADSTVQSHIIDNSVGKAFAGYDVACNITYVAGALTGLFCAPARSPLPFVVLGLIYFGAAAIPLSSIGISRLAFARISMPNPRRPR